MTSNKPMDMKNSIPFVKIVEARMTLMENLKITDGDTIRIVSILGKARMGKSTFLNAIISRIHNTNIAPFQTQDDDEHCTRGMDMYYCKEKQLLLLDCQGLALEDSSHDPALLLFAYLISDTIVFNERMMLQNEALKLLEPICTFMAYINLEEIKQPKLYFRISDGDMVKNPQKNLDKVMTHYNDQYQSIRDSVAHLFQPAIGIVKTNALDCAAKDILQTGNYLSLFTNARLGFAEAIDELLASLPAGQSAAAWKHKIPTIIESINKNEKITIDKLDVVGQTAKIEIMEWVNALPVDLFVPMAVGGTQKEHDDVIKPRKLKKKNTLSEFTRLFKSISGTIKDTQYATLQQRLNEPIKNAEGECAAAAERLLEPLLTSLRSHKFPDITTETGSVTNTDAQFIRQYLAPVHHINTACTVLYEPVRTKYQELMRGIEIAFMTKVHNVAKEEKEEIRQITELCKTTIQNFEEEVKKMISCMIDIKYRDRQTPMLLLELPVILEIIIKSYIKCSEMELTNIAKVRIIKYNAYTVVLEGDKRAHPMTYDLIKPIYDEFLVELWRFMTSSVLLEALVQRKKALLYGKAIDKNVIVPDIEFVEIGKDETIGQELFKMTSETFETIYKKNILATLVHMKVKQYIKEEDISLYFGVEPIVQKILGHKLPFINTMFRNTYAKILANAYATGKPVVEFMEIKPVSSVSGDVIHHVVETSADTLTRVHERLNWDLACR